MRIAGNVCHVFRRTQVDGEENVFGEKSPRNPPKKPNRKHGYVRPGVYTSRAHTLPITVGIIRHKCPSISYLYCIVFGNTPCSADEQPSCILAFLRYRSGTQVLRSVFRFPFARAAVHHVSVASVLSRDPLPEPRRGYLVVSSIGICASSINAVLGVCNLAQWKKILKFTWRGTNWTCLPRRPLHAIKLR